MIGNFPAVLKFNQLFLKLNRFICNELPLLPDHRLTPNACWGREWPTTSAFLDFEYESNGFCKYGKGKICWHGVGENYHDLKKIKIHGVE